MKSLYYECIWRFAEEESSIWKDIIKLKYQVEEKGCSPKFQEEAMGWPLTS